MAMNFPTFIHNLMGYIVKVAEYKYSVPILRMTCYVMECNLCLFSPARSQISLAMCSDDDCELYKWISSNALINCNPLVWDPLEGDCMGFTYKVTPSSGAFDTREYQG